MAYVNSRKIKVFPSAYRGFYSNDESGIISFDPEARLNTEYHWVRSANNITNPKNEGAKVYSSYIVNYNINSNPTQISFVLGGYYFELQEPSSLRETNKPLWVACRIAERKWDAEDRYVDTCLQPFDNSISTENLDREITPTSGNYEFLGLNISNSQPTDAGIVYLKLLDESGNIIKENCYNNGSLNIQDAEGDITKPIAKQFTSTGIICKKDGDGKYIWWIDSNGITVNAQNKPQANIGVVEGLPNDAIVTWDNAINRWYAEFINLDYGYKEFALSKTLTFSIDPNNPHMFNKSYVIKDPDFDKYECMDMYTYIPHLDSETLETAFNKVPVYKLDANGNIVSFTIAADAKFQNLEGQNIKGKDFTIETLKLDKIECSGEAKAGSFYSKSDKRLKENIKEFKYNKSILDLPIYTFDFKEGPKDQIGCLAQDLQKLYPELVKEDDKEYLTIQENKLVYLLLEEVKQLKERISKLESKKE